MISARQVIQSAFIGTPELKDKDPEEVIRAISSSVQTKVIDRFTEKEINAPITVTYLKSNIKGNCYFIVCDICSARCRKAYLKEVWFNQNPVDKVLCGKCARIKYKRKTVEEKKAIDLVLHPEKMMTVLKNRNFKNALIALEAWNLREKLEEKAERLANKITGEHRPEIIE